MHTTIELIRKQGPCINIASQNCIFMNELCHVVSYYFSPCVVIFCCAEEMKTHDSDLVAGLAADSVLEVHKVQVRTLGCLNKF